MLQVFHLLNITYLKKIQAIVSVLSRYYTDTLHFHIARERERLDERQTQTGELSNPFCFYSRPTCKSKLHTS